MMSAMAPFSRGFGLAGSGEVLFDLDRLLVRWQGMWLVILDVGGLGSGRTHRSAPTDRRRDTQLGCLILH